MPTIRELSPTERPVARLHEAGAEALSLTELLATLIGGPDALELATTLLTTWGAAGLVRLSPQVLEQMPGIGPVRAARVAAALALGRRLLSQEAAIPGPFTTPEAVARYLMPQLAHREHEMVLLLLLDQKARLVRQVTLYQGTLSGSLTRVAECFREAVRVGAAQLIVAHNHPSGDPTPSPGDLQFTREMRQAGELLDLPLVDHLIIGHTRWVSCRERHWLIP